MNLEESLFDIIIVGGGLVGNTLALALAGGNLKIAIIEANTKEQIVNSAMGDRALALSAGSVDSLKSLNAWQAIQDKATPITDIHVSDKGHFGKTRLSARKESVEALGYVIIARDIEDHLIELTDKANVTRLCPARLIGFATDNDYVHASIKHQDQSLCLKAKLLVGADGGNSSVRKLLDIEQNITDYDQVALVTTVKTGLPHHNVAYERFAGSGPLAMLPLGKQHCAVVWTRTTQDAEQLMASNEADFLETLQSCFGYRLGKLTLAAPRRAFPVPLIRAQAIQSNRVLLIGNAAHQLHPVAGQGFNLGLRDAMQLADMLSQQHTSAHDIGDRIFLAGYVSARQKDLNQTVAFTDTLVRLFSMENLAITAARNIGLTSFDHLPFAKSLLAKHAMGLAQKM